MNWRLMPFSDTSPLQWKSLMEGCTKSPTCHLSPRRCSNILGHSHRMARGCRFGSFSQQRPQESSRAKPNQTLCNSRANNSSKQMKFRSQLSDNMDRKSRRIAAFLMFSSSQLEEVSPNSFVSKLADRQTDRQIDR